jgi:predicted transglutaminase-like cysteine proteinase
MKLPSRLTGKNILAIVGAMIILASLVYGVLALTSLTKISHQPATFSQMRALVTPNDDGVKTVLAEALAVPSQVAKGQTGDMVAFEKIRDWLASQIKYTLDEEAHGVSDYWQTPSETLELGTGDCEDLSILLVSLLRAYGVPLDQVFVAVGNDLNDNWHAYVIERFYYGIWRVLDAEYARNATFVGSFGGETYHTTYCFNDTRSFNGLPVYPGNYVVPEIPVTTGVSPINTTIYFTGVPEIPVTTGIGPFTTAMTMEVLPNRTPFEGGVRLRDPSFDEVKQRLGKLWLPSYLPAGYKLSSSWLLRDGSVDFVYQKSLSSDLEILEYSSGGEMEFPEDTVSEVMVNGDLAYLVRGGWTMQGTLPNRTLTWNNNQALTLYFNLDGWIITVRGFWADSWTEEELIKIAESLTPY